MNNNNQYQTLSEASKALSQEGFTSPLDIHNANEATLNDRRYLAKDLLITEFHRFEGVSNPADSSVIYAVEAKEGQDKGTIIDAYGADSDKSEAEFIRNLEIKQ